MALVLAILAGISLSGILGDKADKAKIRQEVLNKVDIKAISKLMIDQTQDTKIKTMTITSMNATAGMGCTIYGNITLKGEGGVKIYDMQDMSTKINDTMINELQEKINTQLEESINQVNKQLLSFLSSNQDASLTADVKNILNKTIKSEVTVKSLQKTSIVAGGVTGQTFHCGCIQSLPDYKECASAAEAGVEAIVYGGVDVTASFWIDITLNSLMNSVIDKFVQDKSVVDWATKEASKITQERQGIFSQIVDALKQWWFLFLGAGIFVFLIIILLFILLFFGGGGKEAVQNWSANQIEMQRQGLQMLRENPQLLATL